MTEKMNSFLFLNCKITRLKIVIERQQSGLIGKLMGLKYQPHAVHLVCFFPN